MKILRSPDEFRRTGAAVFGAVGVFDGVHLGHQQILRGAIEESRRSNGQTLVVTFDRHPNAVVASDKVPPFIYPLHKRLEVVRELGPDMLWLIPFDEAFSRKTGASFAEQLASDFAPLESLWIGADFRFGHKRRGDVALLRDTGARFRFNVHATPAVLADGHPISSTRIREVIMRGDLDAAAKMLGRPYTLAGKVVEGDRLGRTLGFPTANMDVKGLAIPPTGVYAALAQSGGKTHQAVLNIGFRPTVCGASKELRCEAHMLDFSGDLYGHEVELSFIAKLREEKLFASTDALRQQIAADIAAAQLLF